MTYIHLRHGWPNLRWDADELAVQLAAVRHRQGRLLGRMQDVGFDFRAEANLAALTSDVVRSSAIEGESLSPDEVRSSIARRLGLDTGGLPTASRGVEGIVEMMLDATQNYAATLTRERLFGWHAALLPTGRSGMSRITVGAWRTEASGPMRVVSGPVGKEKVHFEAPDARRLDANMTAFLDWFNGSGHVDPVVKAGVAHLWFVTVQPFEDGNGRIGRAIADMSLARADESHKRFYSMSTQIEAEREDYCRRLESAQRGGLDVTSWLIWFLGCLDRALVTADTTLESTLSRARLWRWINARPLNERQREIVTRMINGFEGFFTTSKYASLVGCSTDTALRDISELVERSILLKNPGGGRSTSYRLAQAPPGL